MSKTHSQDGFLALHDGVYYGLCNASNEDEAAKEAERLGYTGGIITRADYEVNVGSIERVRQEKLDKLSDRLGPVGWLECMEPSALNAKGKRALGIVNKIKHLQVASATEVESYDPDSDPDINVTP